MHWLYTCVHTYVCACSTCVWCMLLCSTNLQPCDYINVLSDPKTWMRTYMGYKITMRYVVHQHTVLMCLCAAWFNSAATFVKTVRTDSVIHTVKGAATCTICYMHEHTRYIGTIRYKEWTIRAHAIHAFMHYIRACNTAAFDTLMYLIFWPDIKVHARLRGVIDDDIEFLVQYRYTIWYMLHTCVRGWINTEYIRTYL
jgi:hypothetical protein